MMRFLSSMLFTHTQIIAIGLGLVNLALYFMHFEDTLQQVKHLLWLFIFIIIYLHENLLLNLFSEEEEEDEDDDEQG